MRPEDRIKGREKKEYGQNKDNESGDDKKGQLSSGPWQGGIK